MEKRQYVCIGAAVVSVAALAFIAAKACGCCCKKSKECDGSSVKTGKCRSEKGKNNNCVQKEETNQETGSMGEEKEPPYYSENYYAKDQDDE